MDGPVVSVLFSSGTAFARQPTRTSWIWRVEDRKSTAPQFEARTGIRVVYTVTHNLEHNTVLSSDLAAGTGPDIFHTRTDGG